MNSKTGFALRLAAGLAMAAAAGRAAEDYALTTFAGAANVTSGADGTPGSFNNPYFVAIDAAKNLYVADTQNNTVRKITPGRVVSTLAGLAGQAGTADGSGSAARFNFPVGIGVDGAGNVYVADSKNFTVRKITAAGAVSTFAGAPFQVGAADGPGGSARFFLPYGIAVDSGGNVYVAEGGNHTIRRITPEGVVSTLAGQAMQSGAANGTGAAARFSVPFGLAVDAAGNVFVADSENHTIRRVTPAGAVTTVAGQAGVSGAVDGPAAGARFNQPRGVAVDAAGNLFVVDHGNNTVRHIATNGTVSTIAGTAGIAGEIDSVGAAARLYSPTGIVADNTTIYVADTNNNTIRRGQPASSAPIPVINLQPFDQVVSTGQTVSFTVAATGTNLGYQWLRNSVAIAGATMATYAIAAASEADVGSYAVRVSGAGGSVDSASVPLSVVPAGSGTIAITSRPLNQNVAPGQSATLSVTASGPGLTYQWLKNGGVLAGATNATLTFAAAQASDAATYTVRLSAGSATETATARLTVGGAAGSGLSITTGPASQTVNAGQSASFSVSAGATGPLTYQWLKNDAPIAGATAASYTIATVQAADAGTYSVRVSSGGQNVVSAPAILTVNGGTAGPTARLSNLSVRTALPANERLIVGMTMTGASGNVLVRAVGPTLGAFGVPATMADPRLELFVGATRVLENDNWTADLAPTFASVGAFALAAGSRDAAFVRGIQDGVTVQAIGATGGVVLVEAYDLGTGTPARLINLSARNQVGTGDNILIAGFTVVGAGQKRVLIRAVGPGLGAFGLTGFLVDPRLEVYNQQSVRIAENDNWTGELAVAAGAVGAFPLTAGSRDAALLTTLGEGSYTVQVSGVGGTTGEALIEVYEVP